MLRSILTIPLFDLVMTRLRRSVEPGKVYIIVLSEEEQARTAEISRRFNGHVTWITKQLREATGKLIPRVQVKYGILKIAMEIDVDGGDPYPTVLSKKKLKSPLGGVVMEDEIEPDMRTSQRSTKEMITACAACQIYADQFELGLLPEKERRV